MEKTQRVVLVLKVDVEGRKLQVLVKEQDEPKTVAQAFCNKYGLGEEVAKSLAKTIDSGLDELVTEELYYNQPGNRGNIGAKMYLKGVQFQQRNQQAIDNERHRKAADELEELTFKPTICRNSVKLIKQKDSVSREITTPQDNRKFERLHEEAVELKHKREHAVNEL